MAFKKASNNSATLPDFLLTPTRDRDAAEAFLRKASRTQGLPEKITIDKSGRNTAAIKRYNQTHKTAIVIRHRKYLNNIVEQDHRGIKQRTRPMGGCKSVESAKRFCRVHDEVRNFLRPRSRRNEVVSLARRRLLYTARTRVLLTSLAAA